MFANGIDLTYVFIIGGGVILPLLLFNAVVEAPLLSRHFNSPWRALIAPAVKANIWSFLAGLPISFMNSALAEWLLPNDLIGRMHSYPVALGFAVLNYYLATVAVEFIWYRRKLAPAGTWRRLLRTVAIANLASYAVLAPLYWFLAQPSAGIIFSHNTSWGEQPPTLLIHVNERGGLNRVYTDGSEAKNLLTNHVAEFVVSEDLNIVLFRNPSNEFFLARGGDVVPIPLPAGKEVPPMAMDFSPDGTRAAFVVKDTSEVLVWELETDRLTELPLSGSRFRSAAFLSWSAKNDRFYFRDSGITHRISFPGSGSGSFDISRLRTNELPVDLAGHYAQQGQNIGSFYGDSRINHSMYSDRAADASIRLLYWSGGGLLARHQERQLRVADNPGLWHFGRRHFPQASFTGNHAEVVFHDGENLYLGSLPLQRVGRIAAGSTFVLVSPNYCKSKALSLFRL